MFGNIEGEAKMADCEIKSYNMVRAEIFGKEPTWIQKLISLRSYPHVHSEFKFSSRKDGVSFSATMQDDCKCARFKQIEYSHEAERWDSVIVPLTDKEEDIAYIEAHVLKGMKYDLMGQICHATKLKIWKPSPDRIWCSKAVARLIYRARPDFLVFLEKYKLTSELRPDQLDMMARYYFERTGEK